MNSFPSGTMGPPEPAMQGRLPDAAISADLFAATGDPLWLMIDREMTPAREREFESLFAVSNGYLGRRGSLPLGMGLAAPALFIAGVFDTAPPASLPELVAFPGWTVLSESIGPERHAIESPTISEHCRILDMRQGVFRRVFRFIDKDGHIVSIRFLRLASLAERHVLLQSSLLTPENFTGPAAIRSGFLAPPAQFGMKLACSTVRRKTRFGAVRILQGKTHGGIEIALAVAPRFAGDGDNVASMPVKRQSGRTADLMEMEIEAGKTYRNDWIEVCYTSRDTRHPAQAAVACLERLLQEGVAPAIRRHVRAWERRWQAADIGIAGDEEAQRAVRFACYHLISAANPGDERVSIGAKALTGPGYKGHVFWDTEIYLLPFFTLTAPDCARALLMYRYHTLPAARDKARKQGYRGALYAWESADTGEETTPAYAVTPLGNVVPVLNGSQAHHISADVAYAVWQYWQATHDDEFLGGAGAEILIETARFWASRGRIEADGFYHIRGVMGPDEYHEGIDDNAYTNWMAQWNLECAAAAAALLRERMPEQWSRLAARIGLAENEPRAWLATGRAMYAGMDAERGLIEQFGGYFELDEIDLAQYAPRSMPIDVILGRERTQRSKIVKQADVAMLLHLLWQRIPAAMRESSFRYYERRTEHGSSLSPAMHALLAARLGEEEMALRYFRQAREIDLADNMGNASSGVHIASLGGIWQAIVFGFAGLTLIGEGLEFMPHCPAGWRSIRFSLLWRGQRLQAQITPGSLTIDLAQGAGLPVSVAGSPVVFLQAGRTSRWLLHENGWTEDCDERR